MITLENKAWGILLTLVHNLSPRNHEEADIRIMYHCTLEDKPTVVIASDTDILILMVHAFASRLPDHDYFLQTNKDKFVDISKIFDYIGNTAAITLPVSYFYRKSKKAIIERQEDNFIKKRPKYRCFPVNIAKSLRAPTLKNNFKRMLLTVRKYLVNDILQLLYKQPSTDIHNASMKIENSCQILEKSIRNKVVGVGSF